MKRGRVKCLGSSREVVRAWKRKVREWGVFLKDDVDFDYAGILRVLLYKLRRTRECIVRNKIICRKSIAEIRREIIEVERLLQRVYDDDYFDKYDRELVRRFGRQRCVKSVDKRGWVCYTWVNDSKERRRALSRAFRLADRDRKRDFSLACGLLGENIWGWWD